MDTRIVERRKNITIARSLDDESRFTANIRIDFIPDELIVKNIIFTQKKLDDPDDIDSVSTSIYTDLVADYIGTFSDVPSGNCVTPNLIFLLKKAINQLFTFDIHISDDNIGDNKMIPYTRTGELTLHLEFIKYREIKTDKIY